MTTARTDRALSPRDALPQMRARLALLNAAIAALQTYQGYLQEDLRDDVSHAAVIAGVRLKPFLIARPR